MRWGMQDGGHEVVVGLVVVGRVVGRGGGLLVGWRRRICL